MGADGVAAAVDAGGAAVAVQRHQARGTHALGAGGGVTAGGV